MTTPKEIRVRDEEMTNILAQSVAKTEHRWVERNFNGKTVTVIQQRRFTFKDFELKCGRWTPELQNIISVKGL